MTSTDWTKSYCNRICLLVAFSFALVLTLQLLGYSDNGPDIITRIPSGLGIQKAHAKIRARGNAHSHAHPNGSIRSDAYDDAARLTNCTLQSFSVSASTRLPAMFRWAWKPNSICYGNLDSGMVVLLVMSNASLEILVAARINRLMYASTHGYKFCSVSSDVDPSRPGAWHKVVALLTTLPLSTWVFIMDADSLILDPSVSLESIISRYGSDQDIIFTNDFDLPRDVEKFDQATVSINTGAMLVRNSAWSVAFWEKIYKDFPEAVQHPWWEQQAALLYRKRNVDDFMKHCVIIPYKVMNSFYPKYKDGDFIVHFAGPVFRNKPTKYKVILQAFYNDGNLCDQRLMIKDWKTLVEKCMKMNC